MKTVLTSAGYDARAFTSPVDFFTISRVASVRLCLGSARSLTKAAGKDYHPFHRRCLQGARPSHQHRTSAPLACSQAIEPNVPSFLSNDFSGALIQPSPPIFHTVRRCFLRLRVRRHSQRIPHVLLIASSTKLVNQLLDTGDIALDFEHLEGDSVLQPRELGVGGWRASSAARGASAALEVVEAHRGVGSCAGVGRGSVGVGGSGVAPSLEQECMITKRGARYTAGSQRGEVDGLLTRRMGESGGRCTWRCSDRPSVRSGGDNDDCDGSKSPALSYPALHRWVGPRRPPRCMHAIYHVR